MHQPSLRFRGLRMLFPQFWNTYLLSFLQLCLGFPALSLLQWDDSQLCEASHWPRLTPPICWCKLIIWGHGFLATLVDSAGQCEIDQMILSDLRCISPVRTSATPGCCDPRIRSLMSNDLRAWLFACSVFPVIRERHANSSRTDASSRLSKLALPSLTNKQLLYKRSASSVGEVNASMLFSYSNTLYLPCIYSGHLILLL